MEVVREVAAGVFLGPIFERLRDKLVSLVVWNYGRQEEIDRQLKKLEKMLPEIGAVLADAEEKQKTDDGIKSWLEDLTDLAYDLDDLLDDFATQTLRLEVESQASSSISAPPPSKVRRLLPTCFTRFTTSSPSAVKLDQNMMSKVEEITTRLQDIQTRKNSLHLKENVGGISPPSRRRERRETTSVVNTQVYGRKTDKDAILELLLRDEASVSVIPIVGMGGIGKTTLAQFVYDDKGLEGRFDLKAWVCVSDDYDVVRVTRAILEAVTSKTPDSDTLNKLQQELKEKLSNKRFLLVLDDIWNEKYTDWLLLRGPLMSGAPGSKIIVTTRLGKVASTMTRSPAYPLKELSKDESLSLFARHALEEENFDAHPALKGIGEEIVSKCKGLPLAVITLAGLLRTKQPHQNEWEDILNSEIWDLPEQKSDILPALTLSYHHLPSHLKQCFAYCAVFSKDYQFDKDELVLLWMGVVLLRLSKGKKRMEDFGNEYFDDLLSRSFFQQSTGASKSHFVMHDLLNDLAQHVTGDICFRLDKLEGDKQFEIPKRARHLSYVRQQFEVLQKFKPLCKVQHLRTFLPMPGWAGHSYLANKVFLDLLPKLHCLRVLSLFGYSITEIPESIGDLKHLRYLNLSKTSISHLPQSVSTLYNLQTLLLRSCKNLCMLPPNIGDLINLRHLDIGDTEQLREMSSGIGRLTNLQTLSKFVVGKNGEPGLKELGNLTLLRGSISITELQNVTDVRDTNEAKLRAKQDLEELKLAWCSEFSEFRKENLQLDVLDKLQPHGDLKRLTIEFYGGTQFSSWIGDPSFTEMVNLTLARCKKCRSLPPLGQLPNLKELCIRGMDELQILGVEFYGNCFPLGLPFPSLEKLKFKDMPAWEEWSCSIGAGEAGRQFPCLRELIIDGCPKLITVLPLRLSSLRTLSLAMCDQVVLKGIVDMTSLTSLSVERIVGLSQLDEALVQSLVALKILIFRGCEQMVALWQNGGGVERLPCIKELDISGCENLVKLPNDLNNLTSLTSLKISSCPKLVRFPETGVPRMLKNLNIQECVALESLPEGICGLEDLAIERCPSLRSWPAKTLPTALKKLDIDGCMNLEYLWKGVSETTMMLQQRQQEEEFNNINIINLSSLEELHIRNWPKVGMLLRGVGCVNNNNFASLRQLEIWGCDGVESLSFPEGGLPSLRILDVGSCVNLRSLPTILQSLESLGIYHCQSLESFPERGCLSSPNLRSLDVFNCVNLKSLPSNQILQSLQSIEIIDCQSLERGCLSTPNLRSLRIFSCSNLRSLLISDQILQSLETIKIEGCPCLESFPRGNWNGNLPPNLTDISIGYYGEGILKPLSEWGLHKLTSLREFKISGGYPELVSFPFSEDDNYCLFPATLTQLEIKNLPNLESISSKGLQNLTSLQQLTIWNCPKLRSLPKEVLPSTLQSLRIIECPLLKQRFMEERGDYWRNIAHIPNLQIDHVDFIPGDSGLIELNTRQIFC